MAGEYEEFTLHCGESQFFHTTCEMPGALPTESGIFKKVMLHFQYLTPRTKHFTELKQCKISSVWLKNIVQKIVDALEKEMATHSSILAWRISGMEEPSGLPSMGSHRVGND